MLIGALVFTAVALVAVVYLLRRASISPREFERGQKKGAAEPGTGEES